jgi:CrcB protein
MVSLSEIVFVVLGGAIGTCLRFLVGRCTESAFPSLEFPGATLFVNILGCLVIGAIAALSARGATSHEVRLFIITGILGGFTTFSAFGLETASLLRAGHIGLAVTYVSSSVIGGIAAVMIGLRLTEK